MTTTATAGDDDGRDDEPERPALPLGLAATMAPGHAVGEAHLTGKPGEGEPVEGSGMEDLEAEINKARENKP